MTAKRWIYLVTGIIGLFIVYLFQAYLDFYSVLIEWEAPEYLSYSTNYQSVHVVSFTVNKVCRYLLNDVCAIAIIYGLFGEQKFVKFAFYVMLFGLVILVPAYLILFFLQPAGYSSMISHLHRLVMNPVLMMLLIPAFYYQNSRTAEVNA